MRTSSHGKGVGNKKQNKGRGSQFGLVAKPVLQSQRQRRQAHVKCRTVDRGREGGRGGYVFFFASFFFVAVAPSMDFGVHGLGGLNFTLHTYMALRQLLRQLVLVPKGRLRATKIDDLSLLLTVLLGDLTSRLVLSLTVEDLVDDAIGLIDLQERLELLRLVKKFVLRNQGLSAGQRCRRGRKGHRRASNLLGNCCIASNGSELDTQSAKHHY